MPATMSGEEHESSVSADRPKDRRVEAILEELMSLPGATLVPFCRALLDRLVDFTGAERGYLLLCHPDSTEAEVVCARHYETTNLSMHEYRVSRTVVGRVMRTGTPLLLEDASSTAGVGDQPSVRAAAARSLLAAPLSYKGSTQGIVYLQHRAPGRFGPPQAEAVELLARFAGFYLGHARLLPSPLDRTDRVFLNGRQAAREIVGGAPQIQEVLGTIRQVANGPATVLIRGESGTGKDLVARALHYESTRRDRPFVALNCAAIPEHLLESELFGHEKGAFTGADRRRLGRIEQANGGTLFFDEINQMPFGMQAKLLRFLQSHEISRVGGDQSIRVDVRVVAASSEDLRELSQRGRFHEALFYRLNVIPIAMPPLRERRDDIPLLTDHFLARYSTLYGKRLELSPEVREWLENQPFPGNVRELENLIHRLVAVTDDGDVRLGDLPRDVRDESWQRLSLRPTDPSPQAEAPQTMADLRSLRSRVHRQLAEEELRLAEHAVAAAGGNVTQAAEQLGIHRVTLHKMLRRREG